MRASTQPTDRFVLHGRVRDFTRRRGGGAVHTTTRPNARGRNSYRMKWRQPHKGVASNSIVTHPLFSRENTT
jgi:hypothetical protein